MSCLFRALGAWQKLHENELRRIICAFIDMDLPVNGVRASQWIAWNYDGVTLEAYLRGAQGMEKASTWGSALEVAVFVRLYHRPVRVWKEFSCSTHRRACLYPQPIDFVIPDDEAWSEAVVLPRVHLTWNGGHYEPLLNPQAVVPRLCSNAPPSRLSSHAPLIQPGRPLTGAPPSRLSSHAPPSRLSSHTPLKPGRSLAGPILRR